MRRIDLKRVIPFGLVALLVLCQACASVVPSEVRKRVDKSITLETCSKTQMPIWAERSCGEGKLLR